MLEQFDAKGVQGYIQGMSALSRRNKIEASRIFVATAQSASDSEIKDRCRISAARTLIEIGEEAAADSQLIAIIDRIPESTYGDQALVLAADVLERRKDIQGAISALTSLLVQYPRSILAPSARERIRRLRGDA